MDIACRRSLRCTAVMPKLRCVVFVALVHLFGCRSGEAQPTSAGGSPPELVTSTRPAAPAPPTGAPAPGTVAPAPAASSAESGVAGGQSNPESEAPKPPEAPAATERADTAKPPNRAEAAKLHQCCVEVENLGKRRGQDGSGISGLSALCEEWVSDLKHGRPLDIDSSTWEEIRLLLDGTSITRGCRDRIFSFEKRE
jgi:hypothetical protein